MRYNTELQNNNAELQNILDSVNALPDAESGDGYLFQYIKDCGGLFKDAVFPENFEITLNYRDANPSFLNMFSNTQNVKKITIKGSMASNEINMQSAFYNSPQLEEVDLTGFFDFIPTSMTHLTTSSTNLKIIKCEFDLTKATGLESAFNSRSLVELRFKKETIFTNIQFRNCSNLSDITIQSIIDGLADLTGLETQTLTLHADVKAKLTEAQISTITGKNWTLA